MHRDIIFPLMIEFFQFLTLSNMSYVQGDIIFPLMKWMLHMAAQWCTSFSSVAQESMATAYPVLQVINHTLVYRWSFSIFFSPQSIIAAFIFLLQYISQPIDVLYLFKRDQRLCRSLPIVLSEWTSNISFLRIEVTPDFHRANFIQKFHQIEAHLCLFSSYSVRSMDYNIQHC